MGVRAFRIIWALIMALSWAPLSAHCQWESLPGAQFFQCADTGSNSPAGDPHCDGTSCCTWELSQFHSLTTHRPMPPLWSLILGTASSELEIIPPLEIRKGILTAAPPDLALPWQFFFRAALPARAPSGIS